VEATRVCLAAAHSAETLHDRAFGRNEVNGFSKMQHAVHDAVCFWKEQVGQV
jgi:hypothetical protein